MARLFDDLANQYLQVLRVPVVSEPVSMGCWFRSDSDTVLQTGIAVGSATDALYLEFAGTTAGDPLAAVSLIDGGATWASAVTTTGYSVDTWHYGLAVFAAHNDRAAYIDGGSKGASSTSIVTDPFDYFTRVGTLDSAVRNVSGAQAEVAIWNVALTDYEAGLLAIGYPAPLIRPGHLAFYLPLDDSDKEWNNRYHMTPVNKPSWAAHPPKVLRMKQRLWTYPTATMGNKVWAVS